jgi:hypothetical protein
MMPDTTWRKMLTKTFEETGDSWDNLEDTTLTEDQLDTEFYSGFGGSEGCPFTLWTRDWVYFPIVYDGAEWPGYAPRNPNGVATEHWGGE